MTPLLAFDTSTELLSIAVEADGRILARDEPGGPRASALIVPAIVDLLREARIELGDLAAIAFGQGPGAFTGLRTACAVAQGLALGAGKPVVPIDSLLAVAEDAREGATRLRVAVAMDARIEEIYAGEYVYGDGVWAVARAPLLTNAAALSARWRAEPPEVVAGSALAAFGAALDTGAARRVPGAQPRAAGMLALARRRLESGGALDAALALPVYLRDKVAQTVDERAAARAAKASRP
ncbi:tRNA (adenosine(37)-N6)-threonylcarbamoyltransferase complex dimerization subunit type 1 TsaB [Piscinibacter koreensis]|uniref:tRNA (Adenosine(37)-N6)-threonylcarbamoyltransferase complex dimerization subunit type 1 TsaB n=1 Tax=Piscinibacter koreensis TaxID=2742824 RepID=A0A7Y6TWU8_9BURK|nr:tRNA (adenosine(37)-N6)-threonylcarbamoyltransferase complex dimerization subunit type 1 TsaB [Schlegelella koreensis]NUZ06455.1 tRNA (adenosine(37)-N6)-threonylcarbamoyltransferase complex dimerization subunit type 1 TsaB [Schlegelella koreensis]